MPLPIEQRTKFFVFVIESPSAPDLYHRRSEGDVISQAVSLNGIHCVVKTAISLEAFNACLKVGISEEMQKFPGFMPLLHISAHGNSEGIQLSDGYMMTWVKLKEYLKPINQALGGSLIVCMSSCEGYSGIRMVMDKNAIDHPYFALIGCSEKPTWGETAVAYATFYHQLARGEFIHDAAEAMRVASGNKHFFLEHSENTHKTFVEFLNNRESQEAIENLEKIVENESPESKTLLKNLLSSSAKIL
ncbi:hypothetical protein ICN42_05180 [Polynucleobacter sp. 71A-WALBACH]|uniref:hypothetical protein n=1 Tax=Polynucleobacter sp. 71A-WALBACH TaxID=2689097 RepID=UPI001C0BAA10|nr:hypothetical protein [Polynucleobacter sp. 71A-WALBACH]MBU3593491.1 hypothetical protein [Polynucleobacter sp. 71A-WALBACH]